MKKNILLVFGIGDSFCSKNSPRVLKNGEKLAADIESLIKNNKRDYYGIVRVNELFDKQEDVNIFKSVQKSRLVEVKLFANPLENRTNHIAIPSLAEKADEVQNGDNFLWIFRPEDFNFHICGIDINGIFIPTLKSMIEAKSDVTVYSDVIKPFSKDTIDFLVSQSKDRTNHLRFGKS